MAVTLLPSPSRVVQDMKEEEAWFCIRPSWQPRLSFLGWTELGFLNA